MTLLLQQMPHLNRLNLLENGVGSIRCTHHDVSPLEIWTRLLEDTSAFLKRLHSTRPLLRREEALTVYNADRAATTAYS